LAQVVDPVGRAFGKARAVIAIAEAGHIEHRVGALIEQEGPSGST
jgi:hypothetical protein